MVKKIHIETLMLASFACALALSGCGKAARNHHSQIVARVNDQEITVLQLNQALRESDAAGSSPTAAKAAVESMVDEELLVQQAAKAKLDRDPNVVQAIEHARRRILAQAFADRTLYPKTPVPLAEIESYYRENPALFENRRAFRFSTFTLQNGDLTRQLSAELSNAHSADEVRTILDRHEIKFETQQVNAVAEDLPMERLAQFAKAEPGDLLTVGEQGGRTMLLSLVSIEERPLSFDNAKPLIERYLTTVRNARATDAYLAHAKETAKISYASQFASLGKTSSGNNGHGESSGPESDQQSVTRVN